MMSNPTHKTLLRIARYLCAFAMALAASLFAQSFSTTTVQGTVYLANGKAASGTVQISWPAFSTAAGQAVTAGRTSLKLRGDGFLSVALAPNQGATPAGLYYTVVYNLSDGSTATEYWTVPAAAQAAISQVRAQVMPAAQAVQAVSKAYVDQAIQQISTSQMSSSGGTLSGPLYLNGDPLVASQAANKHYVDGQFAQALPRSGGVAGGPLTGTQLGAVYQVDQMQGADFGAQIQACVDKLAGTNGGTCDARNFAGTLTMANDVNVATANLTIYLPCSTIATSASFVVTPGTRNVTLHGCASRGTSAASGSQGGTVFAYSGSGLFFKVGDPGYVVDTLGFHLDNVVVNTTSAPSPTAQVLAAYRTQEMHVESLYLLGNGNQTGMTLDGTGNYTGGTFTDVELVGFQTGINAIGHQVDNSATTDWLNASTFLRPHIVCPVSNGNPIAGTVGINLAQGDGNTFTGGDVEGCATALHLGPNAQNNTIIGLRNENSISQVIADAGSSYNSWISGGTMFTGKLTDNGTRNSFMDTFHRAFNSLNGDWFGTQQDATLTNHYRLGIGAGDERGLLTRYQTDYGYRWTMGLSDASAGAQFYQVQDELNGVYRLSIGQYNPGQPSTNNQTVLNAAGTGAVLLNGSNNAGTGGVVFGSGGPSSKTVATVDKAGNANFTGTLQVGGNSQSTGTMTVRNNADAEVDYYLWPGLTTNQKGSFTYKDNAGNSQWYMVKDASNNWALNSAVGGLDSIKAYQSNNSGDTYINASNASGVVRVNYETGSGAAFNVYGGSSSNLYASFSGASAIKFPGLASASGKNCLQIDAYGWMSNTGAPCGAGGLNGTVNSGSAGQIAYYSTSGTSLGGLSAVPLASGGTGASDATTALANLGALPAAGGTMTGALNGTSAVFSGSMAAAQAVAGAVNGTISVGACAAANKPVWCSGSDVGAWINAANSQTAATIEVPPGLIGQTVTTPPTFASGRTYVFKSPLTWSVSPTLQSNVVLRGDSASATQKLPAGVWMNASNVSNVRLENFWFSNLSNTNSSNLVLLCKACSDVTVTGNHAVATGLIQSDTTAASYSAVNSSNISQRINVADNFVEGQGNQVSVAVFKYTSDATSSNNRAFNAQFNTWWWGGDSNFSADGAIANPRWAQNINIIGGIAKNVQAGFWGSMGQDVSISGVTVDTCSDVGLDVEGTFRAAVTGFTVRNCQNGGLSTFFGTQHARFANGIVTCDTAACAPFHIYNSSVDPGQSFDVSIKNVTFNCLDTVALCQAPFETAGGMDISGNHFLNTYLAPSRSAAASGFKIEDNEMRFTFVPASAFSAISVSQVGGYSTVADISGNRIISTVTQPAGNYGINVTDSDYNFSNTLTVASNKVYGFTNEAKFVAGSANAGITPQFRLTNNMWQNNSVIKTVTGTHGAFFDAPPNSQFLYRAQGGTGPVWVHLGTWVAGQPPESFTAILSSSNNADVGGNQQTVAVLTCATADYQGAPNLSGCTLSPLSAGLALAPFAAAKLAATGGSASATNASWEVYVQLSTPYASVSMNYPSIAPDAQWTGLMSGGTDPGPASSTVVVARAFPGLDSTQVPTVANPSPSGTCTGNGYITEVINGTPVRVATCQ